MYKNNMTDKKQAEIEELKAQIKNLHRTINKTADKLRVLYNDEELGTYFAEEIGDIIKFLNK